MGPWTFCARSDDQQGSFTSSQEPPGKVAWPPVKAGSGDRGSGPSVNGEGL